MQFHKNRFSNGRVVLRGQTDGQGGVLVAVRSANTTVTIKTNRKTLATL
jgi:hypothetical protein